MKTILGICFGIILTVICLASSSSAQTNRGGINNREHNQRQRIVNGVRSGELTRREAQRLTREQARIRREEARFRHSGEGLSNRERARLERDLNRSSRHIRRQTHDGQNRSRP